MGCGLEPQPIPKLTDEQSRSVLKDTLKELDDITFHIDQLQKFSRINFTGFLKAAKKHDRRTRGAEEKGKKKTGPGGGGPMVRPLLQVRLGALEFNKEVYSPMLYRYVFSWCLEVTESDIWCSLSAMYAFVREHLEVDTSSVDGQTRPGHEETQSVQQHSTTKRYTSYKCMYTLINLLENIAKDAPSQSGSTPITISKSRHTLSVASQSSFTTLNIRSSLMWLKPTQPLTHSTSIILNLASTQTKWKRSLVLHLCDYAGMASSHPNRTSASSVKLCKDLLMTVRMWRV